MASFASCSTEISKTARSGTATTRSNSPIISVSKLLAPYSKAHDKLTTKIPSSRKQHMKKTEIFFSNDLVLETSFHMLSNSETYFTRD